MKFKIRHADQIVGFFSIVAVVALLVLIFAIGSSQKWFVKKNVYRTQFLSGSSLKVGMDLTYKGFSIGKIKSIALKNYIVEVEFYILNDYIGYVRENSLVELVVSPIGLGGQFLLHPGFSKEMLPPGSMIYSTESPQGRKIIDEKKCFVINSTDSIGVLLSKVSTLIENLNKITGDLSYALSGQKSMFNASRQETKVEQLFANITEITKNLSDLTKGLSNPTGIVPLVMGEEFEMKISEILNSVAILAESLEGTGTKAESIIDQNSPQIESILAQLDSLMIQLQDVMEGVKNNPLIRKGVPSHKNENAAPINLRDGEF